MSLDPAPSFDISQISSVETSLMRRTEDGNAEPDSLALLHDYLLGDARADLIRHHQGRYIGFANLAVNRTRKDQWGNIRPDPHYGLANKWQGEVRRMDGLLDRQVELRVLAAVI